MGRRVGVGGQNTCLPPTLVFVDAAAERRECEGIAEELVRLGHSLWFEGYFFGTDRAEGQSSGGYGNDALAGLAFASQIAGELGRGCLVLLDTDNRYGAAALARQLVEVEYLAWWFETNAPEAARWMRSSGEGANDLFRPSNLRKLSAGIFDRKEYSLHCELGGHPHPSARMLLPCHEPGLSKQDLLGDVRHHLVHILDRVRRASDSLGSAMDMRHNAMPVYAPDGATQTLDTVPTVDCEDDS